MNRPSMTRPRAAIAATLGAAAVAIAAFAAPASAAGISFSLATVGAYGGATGFSGQISEVRSDVDDLTVQGSVFHDSRQIGLYLPNGGREVRDSRFG